jgi:acetyltransferase-like isoleucine patch superfamily enzyme
MIRSGLLWGAQLVTRLLPPFEFGRVRVLLLRLGGVRIGHGTIFAGRVWIGGGSHPFRRLQIGPRCFINDEIRFDTSGQITIGDSVYVGHDVAIITSSHEIGPPWCRAGTNTVEPVVIGSGTWLGARALILPGVTIGEGAIVASGSVVNRSVPPHEVVAGVPAKTVRVLTDGDDADRLQIADDVNVAARRR